MMTGSSWPAWGDGSLLEDGADVTPVGDATLKGFDEPVALYEVRPSSREG